MKKIKTVSMLFLLSLFATQAVGSEFDRFVAMQSISIHFEKFNDRNAFHPGLGYEYSPTKSFGWQAGVFKDSFAYSSGYIGANYTFVDGTLLGMPARVILSTNIIHKKFMKNRDPSTKIIPMPIVEINVMRNLLVNLSMTPQLDYAGSHTNGLVFVQFKMGLGTLELSS